MSLAEITPVPISQYDVEFNLILSLYKGRKPHSVLEIGTHHGGTLYHWITNAPDRARIISIDDQHINSSLYDRWSDYRVRVLWHKGNSREAAAIDFAKTYGPYDWIFIDADHSYEGVKADWENYSPLINKGGAIALHDITPHPNREVDRFWDEIKAEYPISMEIISNEEEWPDRAGIGVIFFD